MKLERVGTESEGLGTQDLESNIELRLSAFSRAESAVVPFEVREGMEGEHTTETDLTRCQQVFNKGEKTHTCYGLYGVFCEIISRLY